MGNDIIDQIRVYCAFGGEATSPLVGTSWFDITASVILSEGINFSRGRTPTDTVARPGTLTLTLDNSKQSGGLSQYTFPDSATWGSSTKWADTSRSWTGYPDFDVVPIKKRNPISVSHATLGFGDMWYGYVESITYGWVDGIRPVVRITAVDRLARLQKKTLPSLILGEQLHDDPLAAWPLDDAILTTSAGDRTVRAGTPPLVVRQAGSGGTLTFGSDTTAGGPGYGPGPDALYCANFAPSSATAGKYLSANSGVGGSTTDTEQTIEAYFLAVSTADSAILSQSYSDRAKHEIAISSGVIVWRAAFTGMTPATATITGTTTVTAGSWYHVAVTQSVSAGTTTVKLYVNGVQEGSTVTHTQWTNLGRAFDSMRVGATVQLTTSGIPADLLFSGLIANVAVYNTAFTATRVAEHAAARYTPTNYVSETVDQKLAAVARIAGLFAGDYDVYYGNEPASAKLAPIPVAGRPLLDVINDIAQAEGTTAWVNGNGKLFISARSLRFDPYYGPTIPASIIDKGTEFTDDLTFLVNDVTVSRVGGATLRATNNASIAAYDTHDQTIANVYVDSDDQARDLATWYANLNANPTPRVNEIAVDLVTAGSLLGYLPSPPVNSPTPDASYIATIGVDDVVYITGLPGSAPTSTLDLFVEGVSHSITESSWVVKIVTSPRYDIYTSTLTLDDATLGLLDGTHTLRF